MIDRNLQGSEPEIPENKVRYPEIIGSAFINFRMAQVSPGS